MRLLLIVGLGALLPGCALSPRAAQAPRVEAGPVQQAWAKTIQQIQRLEARRARRADWRAAAQFEEPVRSRRDLDAVVAGLGLRDLDEVEAVAWFQRGGFVGHYGFPANFHALVFFDRSGRAVRVLR